MPENDNTIMIEGARIVFRNFAGVEGQYNRAGDRNFSVLLDPEIASRLNEDGWNVKYLKPRELDEEGSEPQAYMTVSVNFKGRPPRVVMITSRGRTDLGENEVEIIDYADIKNVDIILNPYHWVVGEKTGIKAYLKSMYVTIEEDALDLKYAGIEDVPTHAGRSID